MSSVLSQLLTAEEFYDFTHRPENRDRHFELEEGEVIEVSRPGERHGVVCSNANWLLGSYMRQKKKGFVTTNDTGIVLHRDPDTVRGPDVAYYFDQVRFDNLAVKYSERVPVLVVETLSPTDRRGAMLRRINRFFDKGVSMVWLLDPDEETVTVFRPNQTPMVLEGDEELTGDDVLLDFRCKALEFFVTGDESSKETP